MSAHPTPRIAITLGDPAGIGPELVAKLLSDPARAASAEITLISDPAELATAGTDAGVAVDYTTTRAVGRPLLLDNGAKRTGTFERKAATEAGGRWAMDNLTTALELAKAGEADAILFAPLNKSSLHMGGMHEQDELRWFEIVLGVDGFTSELNVVPGLWTSRVTSHVALPDVAAGITRGRVAAAGHLLDAVLRDAGIDTPRIGVCALNPHAGESGRFGRHEIDIIAPAIGDMRADGLDVTGPFPSDTIFIKAFAGDFDGVLTMYHDQGQIAMKLKGFDGGVTMQGGLPVPICTPAHGTAFDLVGRGVADTASIENAFALATRLGTRRRAAG